ncbi:E3 ubiquitin-protein ligase TRIM33,Transcription intermediary factor 1-alpha,Tripartite motif-containing protein 66 [Mytilus coruscus]|uniref:RING-type E3 ubiquitin transferase n=1 Tax=Mytilus coruscus TaxID=42192 RepID=A0A6J8A3E0_MYTCO|nr:E3 ubiquitin-protein ligase TRIM33,Transcription intermediary factor 1-alpha,Tripartite motif-containing protein 66 [Mytilus coruscus]
MAEETVSLNGEEDELSQLKICVLCATDLKDKSPKLLPCLHSLCENCLNSLFQLQVQQQTEGSSTTNNNEKSEPKPSTILCPACNCTVEKSAVVDNRFLSIEAPAVIEEEDEEEKDDEGPICTGCEESQNAKATSFCNECQEYLCNECVFAHKRVRITKDHTIVPKDEGKKDDDSPDNSTQKMINCQTHKHEQLKLFCETCEKLTCRDCQLLEHKDHKYQFLQEAITHQRENLQNAVVNLKTKLGNYKQANEILKGKHHELRKRMTEESEKIVKARDTVIEKFKKYSESLINHLEQYVSNKTTIIAEKQRLVAEALLKMQHSVDFVENALTIGDDVSILYTKGLMVKNLKQLSESGIPFQPSFLNYSIVYENEIDILIKNQQKLGFLQIDGNWFPQKTVTVAVPQSQGNHPVIPQQQQNRTQRFPSTHIMQAAFNAQIREKIRHLPPEQQSVYEAKLREKFRMQQQQAQIKAQEQAQQAQMNRNQNTSIVQNQLNNHVMNRPNQHGVPNRSLPQQNSQLAMTAAGHLAALSQQRHSPQPPHYRNIAPAVPGAQAAAYANKTPSPAGAGFDHQSGAAASQPAPIDQLQAWASQTVQSDYQKFKREERSSCAFSSSAQEKRLPTPPSLKPASTPVSAETTQTSNPRTPIYPPSTGKSMPQTKEEDPNEDWCAVCQNGGDLLCCDKCPKVYHLKCHVPELSQFPCGEWQCTLCKTDEQVVLKEKENKEFSYIPGTKRKAPTGLSEHERKTCERILLELFIHEKSTVFHEPVSKAVPNYYKIITNPIDFSKIKVKIQRQNFNHYDSVEEFIADVKLVFQNCATYNAATSEIGIAGKIVEEEFERLVQKYLPCYMDSYDEIRHRQTSPNPESDASKAKKSKGYEHDPSVTMNVH